MGHGLGAIKYSSHCYAPDATIIDLCLVLFPWPPLACSYGWRRLAGSAIGGIRETQGMLGVCAAHGITADVELIRIQRINNAYEGLLKGNVKYCFVIDMTWVE